MPPQTFRALIGEHAFDITLNGDALTVDDAPVDGSLARVGEHHFSLLIDGRSVPVTVTDADERRVRLTIDGQAYDVRVQDEHDLLLERYGLDEAAGPAEREIRAPMPGLVLKVMVTPGQSVQQGDGLLVLEAMKMENELRAPADGVIEAVHVAPNDAVDKEALLIELEVD